MNRPSAAFLQSVTGTVCPTPLSDKTLPGGPEIRLINRECSSTIKLTAFTLVHGVIPGCCVGNRFVAWIRFLWSIGRFGLPEQVNPVHLKLAGADQSRVPAFARNTPRCLPGQALNVKREKDRSQAGWGSTRRIRLRPEKRGTDAMRSNAISVSAQLSIQRMGTVSSPNATGSRG